MHCDVLRVIPMEKAITKNDRNQFLKIILRMTKEEYCQEDKSLLNLMLKKALVSKHNTYMGGNLVELR